MLQTTSFTRQYPLNVPLQLARLSQAFLLALALMGMIALLLTPLPSLTTEKRQTPPEEMAAAQPLITLPADLPERDWGKIMGQIRRDQYAIKGSSAGSYRASNRGQGINLLFTPAGLQASAKDLLSGRVNRQLDREAPPPPWHWNLSLSGFGCRGAIQPTGEPTQHAVDNRLEYSYNDLRLRDANVQPSTANRQPSILEWYVNSAKGIEHGFTINRPPRPNRQSPIANPQSPLILQMVLDTTLTPRLIDKGQAISFRDAAGQTILRYDQLHVYDADGVELPALFELVSSPLNPLRWGGRLREVGGGQDFYTLNILINAANAHYPLTVDPLLTTQVAKLTATDGAEDDRFGYAVSVNGDTVVVGAPYDDDKGNDSGSAYIFSRNQGGDDVWGQTAKLIAADGAANNCFGWSVSVNGDTVVVGALYDDDKGNDSGSAYIFSRNQGGVDNWGQTAKLTATDGASYEYFGASVSVSGDTVVVGAPVDNDNGSAYIFSRNQGGADNWGQTAKLTATDGAVYDEFGISVSVSGDMVVVGAWHNNDKGSNSGSAYIFSRNQGGVDNWGQTAKLTAADGAVNDLFGGSVSVSGDTVVVGEPFDNDKGDDSGSAYIFGRNQGGDDVWGQTAKLTAADGAVDDLFGESVSVSGDTVVVGASFDDDKGSYSGSAYIFSRNQGGGDNWGQTTKLTAADGAVDDTFGGSVSVSGDTVVVGASFDGDKGSNSGSAYIMVNSFSIYLPLILNR